MADLFLKEESGGGGGRPVKNVSKKGRDSFVHGE